MVKMRDISVIHALDCWLEKESRSTSQDAIGAEVGQLLILIAWARSKTAALDLEALERAPAQLCTGPVPFYCKSCSTSASTGIHHFAVAMRQGAEPETPVRHADPVPAVPSRHASPRRTRQTC